ncbi:MAG: type II secretion system protein GspE [Deltaproteobacteria bacterium]|nr:MAG: type II secretion system protein GspE [Deltaproteobacteria bacterium]
MIPTLITFLQERFQLTPETAALIQAAAPQDRIQTILQKGDIAEPALLEALSERYGIPCAESLSSDGVLSDFTDQIPIQFLRRHLMVPLGKAQPDGRGRAYRVVVNDPMAIEPVDDLLRTLGWADGCGPDDRVLASRETILSLINALYGRSRDSAAQLVEDMAENGSRIITEIEETADLLDDTRDAPIIKLVNHVLSQAIKARASDVHIEPFQDSFKIRYRVDGILYDLLTPPKWIQQSLISRIKVMAKLNIAEKRLPQDGRMEVRIGHQDIDIRVSIVPTTFGERVVLRLLNKSTSLLELSQLGMSDEIRSDLERLIRLPNGIILVTGPTGSGKTTTLYAILNHLNSPNVNIITIEDPVEYKIKGIGQIQVNPKIDLTFAKGLRSIVRQDPDVILVGEIRDGETAEIAVQSALTGHLVFSTLHTNDAASAVTRLVDIGVEPFLLTSAVKAVVAQRLVRVLCDKCKEAYAPDAFSLSRIGIIPAQMKGATLYRAKGCEACINTGYRGRMSIFEVMVMDTGLRNLIQHTSDGNQIKQEAIEKQGMVTLRRDGLAKVLAGTTTIEEVLRVASR